MNIFFYSYTISNLQVTYYGRYIAALKLLLLAPSKRATSARMGGGYCSPRCILFIACLGWLALCFALCLALGVAGEAWDAVAGRVGVVGAVGGAVGGDSRSNLKGDTGGLAGGAVDGRKSEKELCDPAPCE